MAKKSTIAFAEKTLTPEQFAAWQAMPVKLSKSQLKAGELPPTQEAKPVCEEPERTPATAEQIRLAREGYDSTDCNIDDDALTSEGEDGTWIQAWVLLPDVNGEDEDDGEYCHGFEKMTAICTEDGNQIGSRIRCEECGAEYGEGE